MLRIHSDYFLARKCYQTSEDKNNRNGKRSVGQREYRAAGL